MMATTACNPWLLFLTIDANVNPVKEAIASKYCHEISFDPIDPRNSLRDSHGSTNHTLRTTMIHNL
jgi:hypothetical protein